MNPYKVGDIVKLKYNLRDAYNEIWDEKGSELEVISISKDGCGLIFNRGLGIHYECVELVKRKEV